jgi:large subunit GTPase 1
LTENDKEEEVKVDTVGAQEEEEDERIRILSAEELVERLVKECPSVEGKLDGNGQQRKMNIGLVGYPNVGKSSTINALVGAKRVAVGATPGKTKHFQVL